MYTLAAVYIQLHNWTVLIPEKYNQLHLDNICIVYLWQDDSQLKEMFTA